MNFKNVRSRTKPRLKSKILLHFINHINRINKKTQAVILW